MLVDESLRTTINVTICEECGGGGGGGGVGEVVGEEG